MFFVSKKKFNALEARVAALETLVNAVDLTDGKTALSVVEEVRERIWPLFSQGAEANAVLIEKVAKLPA